MAEEPSSTELAEADEAETPAPAEEPMETVTVSLTKKKGEIIQKNCCKAEQVCDEKENSDWLPKKFESFGNTDRSRTYFGDYFFQYIAQNKQFL